MTQRKFVIWIDDEPNQVFGEIFDLENHQYETKYFRDPAKALDWFRDNSKIVVNAHRIIVDLLMPSHQDPRLQDPENRRPVGLRLCNALKDTEYWDAIQSKIILYTRSARAETYQSARHYADNQNITLLRKESTSRIAMELIERGRL